MDESGDNISSVMSEYGDANINSNDLKVDSRNGQDSVPDKPESEVDAISALPSTTTSSLQSAIMFKIPSIKLGNTTNLTSPRTNTVESKSSNVNVANIPAPQLPVSVTSKEKLKSLSPAQQIKQAESAVPYKEPAWGGIPDDKYYFEVLKNGAIVDKVELSPRSYHVFGRLPSCDVQMEHPSLSRYHAVVQFCKHDPGKNGWYLYDLDSTHGTWVNKIKVPPNQFRRIRVGHQVKFGGSTRLHILQGPDTDQDSESQLSVTEIREQRQKQERLAEVLRQAEKEVVEQITSVEPASACSWGMAEDATDETTEDAPLTGDAAVLSQTVADEQLYIDDPKKALKGFYEREGCGLPEYEFAEAGFGKKKCTIELPIDEANGEPMFAEFTGTGKKKELTVACALEACRILDRQGVLRAATHESHKRKKRNWEDDDYYSSDEDTFLDRTGTIERKRVNRMRKEGKDGPKGDTYEELLSKHNDVVKEIQDLQGQLDKAKADAAAIEDEPQDELDAYMNTIKFGIMDTSTKIKIRSRLLILRKEEARLRGLVNMAKPASLPAIVSPEIKSKVALPSQAAQIYGKVRKLHAQNAAKKLANKKREDRKNEDDNSDEFEESEDEEDEDMKSDEDNSCEEKLKSTNKYSTNILPKSLPVTTEKVPLSQVNKLKSDRFKGNNVITEVSQQQSTSTKLEHVEPKTESLKFQLKTTKLMPNALKTMSVKSKPIPMDIGKAVETQDIVKVVKVPDNSMQKSEIVKQSREIITEREITKEPDVLKTDIVKTDIVKTDIMKPVHTKDDIMKAGDKKTEIMKADLTKMDSSDNVSSQKMVLSSKKKGKVASDLVAPKKLKHSTKPQADEDFAPDPDYVGWLPPKGQSGDGKTKLNERFGY